MHGGGVMVPQLGYGHQSFESRWWYDTEITDANVNPGQQKVNETVQVIEEGEKPSLRSSCPSGEHYFLTPMGGTLAD
jgi:hypothetical protein